MKIFSIYQPKSIWWPREDIVPMVRLLEKKKKRDEICSTLISQWIDHYHWFVIDDRIGSLQQREKKAQNDKLNIRFLFVQLGSSVSPSLVILMSLRRCFYMWFSFVNRLVVNDSSIVLTQSSVDRWDVTPSNRHRSILFDNLVRFSTIDFRFVFSVLSSDGNFIIHWRSFPFLNLRLYGIDQLSP